jgi:hypothetical protein
MTSLFDLPKALFSETSIHLSGKGLSVIVPDGSLQDCSFDMTGSVKERNLKSLNGSVAVGYAIFDTWEIFHVAGFVNYEDEIVRVKNISGTFYDGELTGSGSFESRSGHYEISCTIHEFDITEIGRDNSQVAQIDGIGNLNVYVLGSGETITALNADLSFARDGRIAAHLLAPVLAYLPKSTQRRDLELLIRAGQKIPLDRAAVNIENTTSQQLAATISFLSEEFNLDVNLKVDINIDGDILQTVRLIGTPKE